MSDQRRLFAWMRYPLPVTLRTPSTRARCNDSSLETRPETLQLANGLRAGFLKGKAVIYTPKGRYLTSQPGRLTSLTECFWALPLAQGRTGGDSSGQTAQDQHTDSTGDVDDEQ